jgi:hypothetical protein
MLIPEGHIEDFIRRYEEAYRERLARDEARAIVTRLVALYERILKPPPSEKSGI